MARVKVPVTKQYWFWVLGTGTISLTIITMKTCQEQWKFQLQSSTGWLRSLPPLSCCQSIESPGVFKITRKSARHDFDYLCFGKLGPTKTDFEGERGGRGVISNPKNYIADFCHYKRYFGHEFRKKSAIWFSENEGGSKAVWNFFWKFIRFGPSFSYTLPKKLSKASRAVARKRNALVNLPVKWMMVN